MEAEAAAAAACWSWRSRYLKVRERQLAHAELTAALSVFTLPAQVLGDLLPHHPLLTFTQRTWNLEEGTHVQVVLQAGGRGGGSTRGEGEGGSSGKAEPRRSSTYRDLLETHLLLAAVGFAATVDLQRHDLPVTADVSEDLAAARPDVGHSPRINCCQALQHQH